MKPAGIPVTSAVTRLCALLLKLPGDAFSRETHQDRLGNSRRFICPRQEGLRRNKAWSLVGKRMSFRFCGILSACLATRFCILSHNDNTKYQKSLWILRCFFLFIASTECPFPGKTWKNLEFSKNFFSEEFFPSGEIKEYYYGIF